MLAPGRDVFRHPDESRLKPEQIGEEPGQGNKAEVEEEEKCDKDLIIFFSARRHSFTRRHAKGLNLLFHKRPDLLPEFFFDQRTRRSLD